MICNPTTTTHASTLNVNQASSTTATLTSAPPQRKKVLIADDNLIFLRALSMKLKGSGFEVITAQDGAGVVSQARANRPDLILLDMNFPPDVAHGGGVFWDGLLIMSWLRRMEETKDTPIIVITGEDANRYREPSLAAGALAFVPKPIRPDELLLLMRRTLGDADVAPGAMNE